MCSTYRNDLQCRMHIFPRTSKGLQGESTYFVYLKMIDESSSDSFARDTIRLTTKSLLKICLNSTGIRKGMKIKHRKGYYLHEIII